MRYVLDGVHGHDDVGEEHGVVLNVGAAQVKQP